MSEHLIIGKDGTARGIHGKVVDAVTKALGKPQIMRASHVEPTNELSQQAMEWLYRHETLHIYVVGETQATGTVAFIANKYMPGAWWSDVFPCGGNCVLGPFDTREAALAAEVQWLHDHNIPVCDSCRGT